jgi:hypothetical protein
MREAICLLTSIEIPKRHAEKERPPKRKRTKERKNLCHRVDSSTGTCRAAQTPVVYLALKKLSCRIVLRSFVIELLWYNEQQRKVQCRAQDAC